MKKTIVMQVCDIDEEQEASEFITWRGPNGSRVTALCKTHFKLLLDRSAAPRPGRRPGNKVVTKGRTTRKRVTRKKQAAKRR